MVVLSVVFTSTTLPTLPASQLGYWAASFSKLTSDRKVTLSTGRFQSSGMLQPVKWLCDKNFSEGLGLFFETLTAMQYSRLIAIPPRNTFGRFQTYNSGGSRSNLFGSFEPPHPPIRPHPLLSIKAAPPTNARGYSACMHCAWCFDLVSVHPTWKLAKMRPQKDIFQKFSGGHAHRLPQEAWLRTLALSLEKEPSSLKSWICPCITCSSKCPNRKLLDCK